MNPLVILILVARGGASEPVTQGAVRAARELLGPEVEIELRELDQLPSDDRALALGRTFRAMATIQLSRDPTEKRQARLHFQLQPNAEWRDRFIEFERGDAPAERGRTIGYALASMLPPRSVEPAPSERSRFASSSPRREEIAPRIAHGQHQVGALDLVGSAAVGVGGPAAGWGGAASGRWYFAFPFALRVGASARSGQVEVAQATSLFIHASAGLAWLPISARAGRPFELGARIDILAMREQLTHFSDDDPEPVPKSRWLPGADAALEGSWFFGPSAALMAALCSEFAFGRTDVTLHLEPVTTIPAVRLLLQAGVRATF